MRLPRRITPSALQAELVARGYGVSERTLVSWRTKGLLPRLASRGRGRGRGRSNFWRSPSLVEQAIVGHTLSTRNYPNDEARLALWFMGFPVIVSKVRDAWLSRLGKMQLSFQKKKRRAEEHQNSCFSSLDDEISALATPFASILAKQFGFDRIEIVQPVIDLFGLTFARGYVVDDDSLQQIGVFMISLMRIPADVQIEASQQDLRDVVQFVKTYMSFSAVRAVANSAKDTQFRLAHRRWRMILKLFDRMSPSFVPDVSARQYLAYGFGRLLIPTIVRFIRDGKLRQIDQTISKIEQFISGNSVEAIFRRLQAENTVTGENKVALRNLCFELGSIWDHHQFPFL